MVGKIAAAHALAVGTARADRAFGAAESPVPLALAAKEYLFRLEWGPHRIESARRLVPAVPAASGRADGVLATFRLCDRDRRVGRGAQVEMFQVVQASGLPCHVFLREPCFLQIALNGPKCNGNYAPPRQEGAS